MRIFKANHLGMCFGVRNAITLANKVATTSQFSVLGELVHNNIVLDELRNKGVHFANLFQEIKYDTVMITAHGCSQKTIASLQSRGYQVLQATCPLVKYVHKTVRQFVENGFHPIIIGRRDHSEVRGVVEDLDEYDVVLSAEDIFNLKERKRYGVVSQTTQPINYVLELVDLLKNRFPDSEVCFVDTVCAPTKQRQDSAIELANQCDVVVVIGGRKSNNTKELVNTCARYCKRVYHIENADELMIEYLMGAETIGITAGTSTPDETIDLVEKKMRLFVEKLIPETVIAAA
ncbi:MAG TPA: 4-hydroxy-3-methylbut-2-enyl diphosphate reductase [Verrucomicrobiota bacterium]|nr:4-hydroxy-3-methylbut-2-enyl diphosphate reductase [Verrucomicrobiota bacterium]